MGLPYIHEQDYPKYYHKYGNTNTDTDTDRDRDGDVKRGGININTDIVDLTGTTGTGGGLTAGSVLGITGNMTSSTRISMNMSGAGTGASNTKTARQAPSAHALLVEMVLAGGGAVQVSARLRRGLRLGLCLGLRLGLCL